ncbi:MAG: porin family protein [Acidobacteria bacterium]|nr:porin family protein [Acidobacteriota bacterium]
MLSFKPFVTAGILLLVTLLTSVLVSAQSDDTKFEAGVQSSVLGRGGGFFFDDATGVGGGGRFTFNLTRYLALEGEMNYFPGAGYNDVRRLQGQFGVKSGLRFNRFGLFGKVRPGFQNIEYEYQVYCIPVEVLCSPRRIKENETGFALDVGGVLEFYPAKRITVRFDVGDTIVSRSEGSPFIINGVFNFYPPEIRHTSHTLQLSTGIGFRF